MKRVLVFIWFSAIIWGCEKEKIDPDKYVIPVQLVASRDQGGILLKWNPNLIALANKATDIYLPDAVDGEVFSL